MSTFSVLVLLLWIGTFTNGKVFVSHGPIGFKYRQCLSRFSKLTAASADEAYEHDLDYLEKNYTQKKKFMNVLSKVNDNGERVLTYYGLMLAGAIARSAAATAVHPLNVIKTVLQCREGKMPEFTWTVLSRGAGGQFLMSIPHGAVSFAVTETAKKQISAFAHNRQIQSVLPERFLNPLLDFVSSAIATFVCSVISTPQMVLTDRIMAGMYPNLLVALPSMLRSEGIGGFYVGWLPALLQKIPSYALTWMFFQQFKLAFHRAVDRAGTAVENTALGALSASVACCLMIPVDTAKTRIVQQRPGAVRHYDGVIDCLEKMVHQEGLSSLYRALPPRLLSVVPMTGIQYGVYELMKRVIIGQPPPKLAKAAAIAQARRRERQRAGSPVGAQFKQLRLVEDDS